MIDFRCAVEHLSELKEHYTEYTESMTICIYVRWLKVALIQEKYAMDSKYY